MTPPRIPVRWGAMSHTRPVPGGLRGVLRHPLIFRPVVMSKFVVTGALVGAAHLGLVTLMVLGGVPIQVALALAFVAALALHFTMNRQWVFASDGGYALHFSRQGARYLATAVLSYAVTATAVAVLPDATGLPELAVFFLAAGAMACVSFVLLNVWVFAPAPEGAG
jgi:putative flippase GtrA